VLAQLRYVLKKRHFPALIFQTLVFVQLVKWHGKIGFGGIPLSGGKPAFRPDKGKKLRT
jgi:hypothetical protein